MIIKGYNGIMDLDLTHVPLNLHKELIKQHHQDIKDYKDEQARLPARLRYENTTLVAIQRMDRVRMAETKRMREAERIKYENQYKMRLPALSMLPLKNDT